MTNSTANDNAGKPLGFGNVIFADFSKKAKRAQPESVAFAA